METLSEEIWNFMTKSQPQFLIYKGLCSRTTQLDSFSEMAMISSKNFWKKMKTKLSDIDYLLLSDEDNVTLNILKYSVDVVLTGLEYETYLLPVNYWENPIFYFLTFTQPRLPFRTDEDYYSYIEMLHQFPMQIEEVKTVLNTGVKKKIVHHKTSVSGPLFQRISEVTECDLEENEFYKPFLKSDHQIDNDTWKDIQDKGRAVIETKLIPSIITLREIVQKEYLPHLRTDISVNSLPSPVGYPSRYQTMLKFYCDIDKTPLEIHEIGLKEVHNLKQRIQKIMDTLNFNGTVREFADFIHDKEEYQFKDENDVMQYCEEYYKTVILPTIMSLFKLQAHLPLLFQQTAGKSPAKAIYNAASHDGSQPATLWVAAADYLNIRKFDIPTLMLHETEPGHHLQACYASQNKSLPKFRNIKDDRKYFLVPARFPLNTAYTEGWGLYAEELGEELGLYEDIYTLFGHLSSNLGRSARVVADTGIHALGWSREQAKQFMIENTTINNRAIEGELDRYITWPGQSVCYTIGYLEIMRLRSMAKKKLGESFKLAEFHHACLWCGQVPLNILGTIVEDYINKCLNADS